MKILIIIPASGYPGNHVPLAPSDFPTGFAYIASALKRAGHEVFGVNPNNDFSFLSAYDMVKTKIKDKLETHDPDIICVGGLCTEFNFIRDVVKIVREISPSTPIICGGGIINNDAEFIFDILGVDYCVIGEGEETVVKLIKEIEQKTCNFDAIDNLGYRMNNRSIFTKRDLSYHKGDIDNLAFPDYEPFDFNLLLEDSRFMTDRNLYRYSRLDNPRPMPIVTARGCPFKCTFCVHDKDTKYRSRSIKNICEEIKVLYEKYNFNILIIVDELFAANKSRIKEFCESVLAGRRDYGWDFDWMFQTHASAALDIETLQMAKNSGCYFFSYSIESASPKILNSMNKRSYPEQISNALKIAKECEVGFGGNYIFGDPAETIETILESFNFVYQHRLFSNFFFVFSFVTPYPGSKIFDHCVENKIITDKLVLYEKNFNGLNMTRIPNDIFMPLKIEIGSIFQKMMINGIPIVQRPSVYKISVVKQGKGRINNSLSFFNFFTTLRFEKNKTEKVFSFIIKKFFSRILILVEATCPHCGKKIKCVEPYQVIELVSFTTIGCPFCNGRICIEFMNIKSPATLLFKRCLFMLGKFLKRKITKRNYQPLNRFNYELSRVNILVEKESDTVKIIVKKLGNDWLRNKVVLDKKDQN